MKFSVPEILMIMLTAEYFIRYAVKFYIKIKGDDSK